MDNRTLVARVAAKLGKNKTDVTRLLEALAGVVRTQCGEMDSVQIPGFGTLEPELEPESVVTDAASGRRTLLPPSVSLHFEPSTVLLNKLK